MRLKRDLKGENNAKEISDALPFLEYEIHKQLVNKLKVKGMNAIFGLKSHLSMSDRTMVLTAVATGVYLTALASPTPPRLVMTTATAASHRDDQQYLERVQRRLEEKIVENINYYGLRRPENGASGKQRASLDQQQIADDMVDNDTDFEIEPSADHDFLIGNRDTCVLEVCKTEKKNIQIGL